MIKDFTKNTMRGFLAFTLAETLIVMGIIGIVSALTLPNLNSSTGEKEKVAKVKKLYQNFDDAVGRATAVYGPMDEWVKTDNSVSAQTTRFGERITEFMKVSKTCTTSTSNSACFKRKNFTTQMDLSSATLYSFILADGTSVAMQYDSNYASTPKNAVWFFVDIDGANKGQGKLGTDVFAFSSNLANGNMMDTLGTPYVSDVTTGRGEAATAWVINYDNMDYLKANSSGKCNGSNVTLNAFANPPVTSCK